MTCHPLEGFFDPPPCAGLAGFTVHVVKQTVLYPIDTIKVRIQAEKADPTRPLWTRGDLFKGCYKGFLVPLVINSPASAVFFAVKDSVKSELKAKIGNPLSTVAAILAAQVPYWLIRQPAEAIKVPFSFSISPFAIHFLLCVPALDWREVPARGLRSQISASVNPRA